MNSILNFIGGLYRDFIVYLSGDFIEYTIKNHYFVYKSIIPISFTIGKYKFLKESDFYNLFNN